MRTDLKVLAQFHLRSLFSVVSDNRSQIGYYLHPIITIVCFIKMALDYQLLFTPENDCIFL